MFDLVADIEKYPEFVPLCRSLSIRSEREKSDRKIIMADMNVGYKSIKETFTCQVVSHQKDNTITVSYIDGPFKFLENKWTFIETETNNCDVYFELDYEFKSRALALLMGSMFDRAFAHFTQAFEDRADKIYGIQFEA